MDLECFNTALKTKLDGIDGPTYSSFYEAFCSVLNIHAPLKIKILRHNNSAFVTKGLRKAIMKRSRLKNKQRSYENWVNYKIQRNRCVNLRSLIHCQKLKRTILQIHIKDITDSKTFWTRIKPYLTRQ